MTRNPDNKLVPSGISIQKLRLIVAAILLLAVILLILSCEKGSYGEHGLAFVAFTWIEDEPEYIEIENEFIPAVFYWDWFYRVDPCIYYIYYEGEGRGFLR